MILGVISVLLRKRGELSKVGIPSDQSELTVTGCRKDLRIKGIRLMTVGGSFDSIKIECLLTGVPFRSFVSATASKVVKSITPRIENRSLFRFRDIWSFHSFVTNARHHRVAAKVAISKKRDHRHSGACNGYRILLTGVGQRKPRRNSLTGVDSCSKQSGVVRKRRIQNLAVQKANANGKHRFGLRAAYVVEIINEGSRRLYRKPANANA
ncbi:hypothetical protein [Rubripirellula tenax]|uniref:hypothetical protein n=1 Tax=Rubripirellula tenax TaxID=2528015 RepID=UPI0011B6ED1B|nr:hypothetical protein [Rubripirellula tenax]